VLLPAACLLALLLALVPGARASHFRYNVMQWAVDPSDPTHHTLILTIEQCWKGDYSWRYTSIKAGTTTSFNPNPEVIHWGDGSSYWDYTLSIRQPAEEGVDYGEGTYGSTGQTYNFVCGSATTKHTYSPTFISGRTSFEINFAAYYNSYSSCCRISNIGPNSWDSFRGYTTVNVAAMLRGESGPGTTGSAMQSLVIGINNKFSIAGVDPEDGPAANGNLTFAFTPPSNVGITENPPAGSVINLPGGGTLDTTVRLTDSTLGSVEWLPLNKGQFVFAVTVTDSSGSDTVIDYMLDVKDKAKMCNTTATTCATQSELENVVGTECAETSNCGSAGSCTVECVDDESPTVVAFNGAGGFKTPLNVLTKLVDTFVDSETTIVVEASDVNPKANLEMTSNMSPKTSVSAALAKTSDPAVTHAGEWTWTFTPDVEGSFVVVFTAQDTSRIEAETIVVVNVVVGAKNYNPTDITLNPSPASVDENKNGVDVGTLTTTDQNTDQEHVYTLVSATWTNGDVTCVNTADRYTLDKLPNVGLSRADSIIKERTDNGDFTSLENVASRVDGVTNNRIAKWVGRATAVCDGSEEDVDVLDRVRITGNTLQLEPSSEFDREGFGGLPYASINVVIETRDPGGLVFEKEFAFAVNDVYESPSNIAWDACTYKETTLGSGDSEERCCVVREKDAGSSATVGTLLTADDDIGETHSYVFSPADDFRAGLVEYGYFSVSGDSIVVDPALDFEEVVFTQRLLDEPSRLDVPLQAEDNNGMQTTKAFTLCVIVEDVNETPTEITLAATGLMENEAAETLVGTLDATDVDAGQSHTFELVTDQGGLFEIKNTNEIWTTATLDYEHADLWEERPSGVPTGAYRVLVRTTDDGANANGDPNLVLEQHPLGRRRRGRAAHGARGPNLHRARKRRDEHRGGDGHGDGPDTGRRARVRDRRRVRRPLRRGRVHGGPVQGHDHGLELVRDQFRNGSGPHLHARHGRYGRAQDDVSGDGRSRGRQRSARSRRRGRGGARERHRRRQRGADDARGRGRRHGGAAQRHHVPNSLGERRRRVCAGLDDGGADARFESDYRARLRPAGR
jgi:DNA uptake protein ComE-like DNA-binding protein